MTVPNLSSLTQPQRDRLSFIELRVWFTGEVRRQDIINRFAVQTAAATRDLAIYKDLAPANVEYDPSSKRYLLGAAFKPLFDFPAERAIAMLTQGFGDGEPLGQKGWILHDGGPVRLTTPRLEILACVTRAISLCKPLRIAYYSISSGKTQREIVPFALIDTGFRWHVRAFDRKSQEFRDFVITRIEKPVLVEGGLVLDHEKWDQDIQWTRIVELELVPHPDKPHPNITEMDCGMQNGVLRLKLRAATAGYTLQKWSVDCSQDHSLKDEPYRLWLSNPLALYGVESANIAPGYRAPISTVMK